MTAYYNEIDPFAAEWLRQLISAGLIAPGDVDERSIVDVRPDDLRAYTQCHFFAGIGVWSHSLRRAGWPDDRPIWTGSCPCQPFSAAGKGAGFDDERHLWPAFFHLIGECGPAVVAGEQVASKDGLGWLDLVQADMEGAGYAFGAVDTCAAGFGAPHIRQRLYWLADAGGERRQQVRRGSSSHESENGWEPNGDNVAAGYGAGSGLADADGRERGGVADGQGRERDGAKAGRQQGYGVAERGGADGGMGDPDSIRQGAIGRFQGREGAHSEGNVLSQGDNRPGPTNGIWSAADWLFCRDGKWRPVEPGTFPLAHGAAARVGFVCAECIQADAQNQNGQDLSAVREVLSSADRSLPSEILQPGLHGAGIHKNAADEGSGPLPSAAHVQSGNLRGVRPERALSTPAPQGRGPDEQHAGQHRNPLREVPLSGACSSTCDRCGKESEWLADAIFKGNRVGRLRGYGNAINAEQATAFIEAYLETEDDRRVRVEGAFA